MLNVRRCLALRDVAPFKKARSRKPLIMQMSLIAFDGAALETLVCIRLGSLAIPMMIADFVAHARTSSLKKCLSQIIQGHSNVIFLKECLDQDAIAEHSGG